MRNSRKILFFLSLAAAFARAETETGPINLTTFAPGVNASDGVLVTMKTPSSTFAGFCGANGVFLPLSGDAGKAVYSSLLAAVVSGKSVAVTYEHNTGASGCLLSSARIE